MKRMLLMPVLAVGVLLVGCRSSTPPPRKDPVLNSPKVHVAMARRLLEVGKYAEARAEAVRALALEEGDSGGHEILAEVHLASGQVAAGLEEAKLAVRWDRRSGSARRVLGRAHLAAGNLDDAIDALETARDLDGGTAHTLRALGGAYLAARRPAEAGRAFRSTLDLDSEDAEARRGVRTVQAIEQVVPRTDTEWAVCTRSSVTRAEVAVLAVATAPLEPALDRMEAKRGWEARDESHDPGEPGDEAPAYEWQDRAQAAFDGAIPGVPRGHWAESGIRLALRCGLFAVPAGGSFEPDRNVTRAEFASVLMESFRCVVAGGDVVQEIPEGPSPFRDVPSDHPAYRAALWAVRGGYLDLPRPDGFDPRGSVGGAEAILALRKVGDEVEAK